MLLFKVCLFLFFCFRVFVFLGLCCLLNCGVVVFFCFVLSFLCFSSFFVFVCCVGLFVFVCSGGSDRRQKLAGASPKRLSPAPLAQRIGPVHFRKVFATFGHLRRLCAH